MVTPAQTRHCLRRCKSLLFFCAEVNRFEVNWREILLGYGASEWEKKENKKKENTYRSIGFVKVSFTNGGPLLGFVSGECRKAPT